MKTMPLVAILLAASPASAQQHRNYEVAPNGSGGYTGTYGNENFDIDTQYGGVSGQIGGRRPGVIQERPSRKAGSIGATQRNCVVDGNGNALCR
ncbi:hypothetical protein M0654_03520 [Rhizobium sp. NTR19]|uniref:Uncharacterized protein n=1 Tax=Neorhizobium turbinariae TaxID=2937795 RepID=A0ABT0IMD1_9HYPH|nr:hypothetical protein [Neorhizobium turbinariae]MCK8779048.1 hypothetical protein [Neorhizobium turbinariae]